MADGRKKRHLHARQAVAHLRGISSALSSSWQIHDLRYAKPKATNQKLIIMYIEMIEVEEEKRPVQRENLKCGDEALHHHQTSCTREPKLLHVVWSSNICFGYERVTPQHLDRCAGSSAAVIHSLHNVGLELCRFQPGSLAAGRRYALHLHHTCWNRNTLRDRHLLTRLMRYSNHARSARLQHRSIRAHQSFL